MEEATELLNAVVSYCAPWWKTYVDVATIQSVVGILQTRFVPDWGIRERETLLDEMTHRIRGDEYKRMMLRIRATDDAHRAAFPIEVAALLAFCAAVAATKRDARSTVSACMASALAALAAILLHFRIIIVDAPPYLHYLVTVLVCAGIAMYVLSMSADLPNKRFKNKVDDAILDELRREMREIREIAVTTQTAVCGMQQAYLAGGSTTAPVAALLEAPTTAALVQAPVTTRSTRAKATKATI